MKKYIIVGALVYAAWYFLIREVPIKPVVVLPKIGDAVPPDANTPGAPLPVITNDNPQDIIAQNLINSITAAYPNYTTEAEFSAASTKLTLNSQPVPVACLRAPCPPGTSIVSKPVEDAAKALIAILDAKALQYGAVLNNDAATFFGQPDAQGNYWEYDQAGNKVNEYDKNGNQY